MMPTNNDWTNTGPELSALFDQMLREYFNHNQAEGNMEGVERADRS